MSDLRLDVSSNTGSRVNGRCFLITWNRPDDVPEADFVSASSDKFDLFWAQLQGLQKSFTGGIGQVERGAVDGRLHWQLSLLFGTAKRINPLRKSVQSLLPGAHIEFNRKPPLACFRYCSKEETRVHGPFMYGDQPRGQGKRTDLDTVCSDFVSNGCNLTDLAQSRPGYFVRYHKGFRELKSQLQPAILARTPPRVIALWGVPGSGKSYRADRCVPNAQRWVESTNGSIYAANYQGQDTHVFEDFTGWVPFRWLCAFLDKYPMSVNAMGKMVPAVRKTVYFTSNSHPSEWYAALEEKNPGKVWPALRRRITEIWHFPFALENPDIAFSGEPVGSAVREE